MNGYLLDTDIVVFLLRGKKDVARRLAEISPSDVYVSEVTVAELEYGNRCSGRYEENRKLVDTFLSAVNVIPFSASIFVYAKERQRLRQQGLSIEDFDLLIGSAAVAQNLVMVTNNVKHYSRIEGIHIDNWALLKAR